MKNRSGKPFKVLIAVVFASAFATAAVVSPVQAHSSAKAMKTLRWYGFVGAVPWAATLDPAEVTDSISYNVMNQVQSNLVALEPNGTVVPSPGHPASCWRKVGGACQAEFTSLAQSVTTKNHLSYVFTLRPHLRFDDGHHLTSYDVKWSLARALSKAAASPVALLYDGHIVGATKDSTSSHPSLSGVKIVNSRVLKIDLNKKIAYFLKTLSYPTGDVLDHRALAGKQAGPIKDYLSNTCVNDGIGQFVYVCRNHKTDPNHSGFFPSGTTPTLTLAPNKRYFGTKPHIRIVMREIADTQTNYKIYKAGAIDVTAVPSSDVSHEIKTDPQFFMFPTSIVDYMTPNSHPDSPFHDVHCRLAIAYGINRNAIDKSILHKTATPTYQVLPQNITGYSKKFITNPSWAPHFNHAKAAAELRQCTALKGYHLVIPYQHTSVDIDNEYGAIASMIRGIIPGYFGSVTLKPMTFNDWLGVVATSKGLDKTNIGKVDISENLWIEDYPDAQDYLTNLLHVGSNYDIGYYNNSTFNHLTDNADVNANAAQRTKQYQTAERVALSQGAWIAIGNDKAPTIVRKTVHGLVGSAAYGEVVPRDDLWANVSI